MSGIKSVIIDAVRSPIGVKRGKIAGNIRADDIAAQVISRLFDRNKKVSKNDVTVELEGNTHLNQQSFDRVLISVGRKPNSADIGLENTGVELDDKGFVKVDKAQKTSDPTIYSH